MARLRLLSLFRERAAVSAVISNVILMGAVIVVGFVALSWANSQVNSYSESYGSTVSMNINRLKEDIAFEYVSYSHVATSLSAYIINCGSIDDVIVSSLHQQCLLEPHLCKRPTLVA
jgi:hypothetical protein